MPRNKPIRMHSGETQLITVDFGPQAGAEGSAEYGVLSADELLAGSPTVTILPATTPALTPANSARNSVALPSINGRFVAISEAVQFKLTGGKAFTTAAEGMVTFEDGETGTQYEATVTCATDSNPARTLVEVVIIEFVSAGTL